MLCAVAPALTAIALGALLEPIGDLTWARYGYSFAPDRATVLSIALIGAGLARAGRWIGHGISRVPARPTTS